MVPLSKSGVRKHRGFESHPLRQTHLGKRASPSTDPPLPRPRPAGCARSSDGSCRRRSEPARRSRRPAPVATGPGSRRGRLVDYGAALEMRFAATRRGFESLPLRHPPAAGPGVRGQACDYRYTLPCRARWGTSGALNLQSAPAGLNSLPRSPRSEAAAPGDVEDRVPRSGESRTVSGPEGSSTQRSSSGAAERPGPSRLRQWARVSVDRRRVHGTFNRPARA
jgi:hypothetical protein